MNKTDAQNRADSPKESSAKLNEASANAGEMLAGNAAYAGKPGQLYIAEFTPQLDWADAGWLAERIDAGEIVACPRCHFLNLPARPYSLDTLKGWPDPLDACMVCAYAYGVDDLYFYLESKALDAAAGDLAAARVRRAETLYDLWMGPSLAADTWVMAEMGETARRIKALSRQPAD